MTKIQTPEWEVRLLVPDQTDDHRWLLESSGLQGGTRFFLLAELSKDPRENVLISSILRGAMAAFSGFFSHPSDFLGRLAGEIKEFCTPGREPRLAIFGLPPDLNRPSFAFIGFPESAIVLRTEEVLEFEPSGETRISFAPISKNP